MEIIYDFNEVNEDNIQIVLATILRTMKNDRFDMEFVATHKFMRLNGKESVFATSINGNGEWITTSKSLVVDGTKKRPGAVHHWDNTDYYRNFVCDYIEAELNSSTTVSFTLTFSS